MTLTGSTKNVPRNIFNLKNGYLEFNLEKVNIEGRHSIPVTTVGNLGWELANVLVTHSKTVATGKECVER